MTSPSTQRNEVSEGFALGLLLLGHVELPGEKYLIDLAFEGAWREWAFAARYPQVSTDLRNGLDGIIAATRAERGHRTFHLYWDNQSWPHQIVKRVPDVELEPADIAEDTGVSVAGWEQLAADFLRRIAATTSK